MKLLEIPRQAVESVLSIAGIRTGTEEPHYLSTKLTDSVEIRRYGPRIAAETTVAGEERQALNEGFRRLAGYIFGGNHRAEKIAMTVPVSQQSGEKIAMTAPVAQSRRGDNGYVIRFYMPSKWTLDTLPAPDDEKVRLVTAPAETLAVLRYSGRSNPSVVAARTSELLATLKGHDVAVDGEPTAWFFDPPWTLPFRRRNEIAVPVRR